MRTRTGWGFLALSLVVGTACASLGMSGCSSSSSGASSPASPSFTLANYPKPPVANAVDPKSALGEGQYYFLYATWGGELGGQWPVAFLLDVLKKEPDFFGNQFEKFGFIPDPNDDLPIGYKRGSYDATLATTTCAACHTGRLPDGSLWFGQPNLQLDSPRLDFELNKRWIAAGHPPLVSTVSASRDSSYGPGRFRIDSDEYPSAVGCDIPVHYNLDQRTRVSSVGGEYDARTEIFISVGAPTGFPLNGADTKTPFPSDDIMNALVAFMTTHDPPLAPAQDPTQTAAGKAVFHAAQCDGCHHPDDVGADGVVTLDYKADGLDRLPGVDPAYPRGSIHVDPLQYYAAFGDPSKAGAAGGSLDPATVNVIKFAYEHQLNVGTSDGYVAPNLHGTWASAPYLNNGSVPTLQDLLSPASERAPTFTVQGFAFDTAQSSNSNAGHEFGTALSASDKAALVAYLNSL